MRLYKMARVGMSSAIALVTVMCACPIGCLAETGFTGGSVAKAQDPPKGATQEGYAFLQRGELDKAIERFQWAAKENAKDIGAFVGLGQAYLAKGQPADAAKALTTATDLNPNQPDMLMMLASALLQLDKMDEALAQYRRAAELSPRRSQPLVAISEVLLQKREFDEAKSLLTRALGYDPDNPGIHYVLGRVYSEQENWSPAISELRAALRMQPQMLPARLTLISALSSAKRYDEAVLDIDPLVKAIPNIKDPNTLIQVRASYAGVLDGVGKFDEAVKEYKAALEINPQAAVLWGNLGWTLYGAGKYDEAIDASRKALERDNTLGYVRFNLGLLYSVKGDAANARKEYDIALKNKTPRDLNAGIDDLKTAAKKPNAPATVKEMIAYLEAAGKSGAPK